MDRNPESVDWNLESVDCGGGQERWEPGRIKARSGRRRSEMRESCQGGRWEKNEGHLITF